MLHGASPSEPRRNVQPTLAGVTYWPRHDPSRQVAVALFGPHGERKRWRKGREAAISPEMIKRLHDECGIEIIDVPRSDELMLLGD